MRLVQRVVVCLEDSIFIYNLKDMKQLHTIMDTPLNKNGLIDLSAAPQSALVAYPGSSEAGTVSQRHYCRRVVNKLCVYVMQNV